MISAYNLLYILAIGQTFNLITGIAGPIMNLLNKQILNLKITASTYICFFLIIYLFKINSIQSIVALFSICIALENILKTFFLIKTTNIKTVYGIR